MKSKGEDRCRACGNFAHHMHHIVPRSRSMAGKRDINNVIPLCARCHRLHHSRKLRLTQDNLTEAERACVIELMGQAWLDHNYPPPPE